MKVLVCGGSGYIGSHTVKELVAKYEVVVLDNLTSGHISLLPDGAIFEQGDIGDKTVLDRIFSKYNIDAVFHFAASSLVGESVKNPLKYYSNNVSATLMLIQKMIEYGVTKFIFSSTAATYGIPDTELITEETATFPISPYGKSKLMVENILMDIAKVQKFEYIILRYFNASGAHISGEIGERHDPETHLIPIILQHLLGESEKISIFGKNYDTRDGTCVRDYIHVTDLANAHILAYEGLLSGKVKNKVFNLGNGEGYSVKEVIETCERISGQSAIIDYAKPRPGDPAVLVASSELIERELGWKPKYKLEEIVESAWKWHSKEALKSKL